MPAVPLPTYPTVRCDKLPEYASMEEAVAILGKTSARIRQMVDHDNFQVVYALGSRPTYFFDRAELKAMARVEKARQVAVEKARQEKADARALAAAS